MSSGYLTRFQNWLKDWDDTKTRHLLMVVLAILTAILIGLIVDGMMNRFINMSIYTRPPILDYSTDKAQLKELLATMPIEAFIIKILSWIIGAFTAAYVAVRMTKIGDFVGWIAGVILMAIYLIGLLGAPNPLWVWIVCPVVTGLSAFGASLLAERVNARVLAAQDA